MKICCYERFITRSSGAADTSTVCDMHRGPWVLLHCQGCAWDPIQPFEPGNLWIEWLI